VPPKHKAKLGTPQHGGAAAPHRNDRVVLIDCAALDCRKLCGAL